MMDSREMAKTSEKTRARDGRWPEIDLHSQIAVKYTHKTFTLQNQGKHG